jgi:hypothetical protein
LQYLREITRKGKKKINKEIRKERLKNILNKYGIMQHPKKNIYILIVTCN